MYQEYFGFVAAPFDLNTDPRFLYLSPDHARARAYLDYAVYKGDALVVITGEIGAGKSTLIHDLTDRTPENSNFLVIHHPHADVMEFLQEVALEWGCTNPSGTKTELLTQIRAELAARFICGTRTTLIIDEAQTLSLEVLEELRMLADHEIDSRKPLSIVFVGQPCLRKTLAGSNMEQLRQRIRLSFHLPALDKHETKGYIERRLGIAGADPYAIFQDETISRIYKYTGGIPRLINVLADLSLTAAWMEGSKVVTAELVNAAIKELGWVPYSRRMHHVVALPGVDELGGHINGATDRVGQRIHRLAKSVKHGAKKTFTSLVAGGQRMKEITWTPFTRWLQQSAPTRFRQAVVGARRSVRSKTGGLVRYCRHFTAAALLYFNKQSSDPGRLGVGMARGLLIGFFGAMVISLALTNAKGPNGPGVGAEVTTMAEPSASLSAQPAFKASALPKSMTTSSLSLESLTTPSPLAPLSYSDHLLLKASSSSLQQQPMGTPVVVELAEALPVSEATLEESVPSLAGLLSANWVLDQNTDSYVIQILAATTSEVVGRFLQGPITDLEIAYYRRLRDEVEWYVFVSGVYPSYQVAKQASLKLPAQALKAKPWIRRVTAVQKDILEAQQLNLVADRN